MLTSKYFTVAMFVIGQKCDTEFVGKFMIYPSSEFRITVLRFIISYLN
jgi:hypothetical protein